MKCTNCGTETENPKFCSRSCAATFNNKHRIIDESGNCYGELTVIERAGKDKSGYALWKAKCSCGNVVYFRGSSLRAGSYKSCGCKRRNRKLDGFSIKYASRVYHQYRGNAISKSLGFFLTPEEFERITQLPCYYCDSASKDNIFAVGYIGNGIDRVVNAIGYRAENVVPCCGLCNHMKSDIDVDVFIAQCKNITKHISNSDP